MKNITKKRVSHPVSWVNSVLLLLYSMEILPGKRTIQWLTDTIRDCLKIITTDKRRYFLATRQANSQTTQQQDEQMTFTPYYI